MSRLIAAVVLAPLGCLAIWFAAVVLAQMDLPVRQGGETMEVGPLMIVASSVISTLLAALLARFLGRSMWTVLAVVVLALSLLGPIFQAERAGAAVVLLAMHLVVGAVVIALLRPPVTAAEPA